MKKAIVLLSGGLDSATTLFYAKQKRFKCFGLSFIYGQKHRKEIESAVRIAKRAKVPLKILKVEVPSRASALTSKSIPIKDKKDERIGRRVPLTYVPARNTVFLSFALSWAEAQGCSHIFMGANALDFSGYPDCRPSFIRAFQRVSALGTKRGIEGRAIKIEAPLISKSKLQILKLAQRLGVPLELTWSCYRGGKFPCGRCESCRLRAKGFREANLIDPTEREIKKKKQKPR